MHFAVVARKEILSEIEICFPFLGSSHGFMAEQVLLFHPYEENLKGQIRLSDVKQLTGPDATIMNSHNRNSNLHPYFH